MKLQEPTEIYDGLNLVKHLLSCSQVIAKVKLLFKQHTVVARYHFIVCQITSHIALHSIMPSIMDHGYRH